MAITKVFGVFIVCVLASQSVAAGGLRHRVRGALQAEPEGGAKGGGEAKEAIEAAKLAVEYLKGITDGVKTDAAAVEKEIAAWGQKIEGISAEKLQQYTTMVSKASVMLINAQVQADDTISGLLKMTDLQINILKKNLDTDKAADAVRNSKLILSAAIKQAATKIEDLKAQVYAAQMAFNQVKDMSALFAKTIQDNLDNKDGWLDAKIGSIRASAYGGCVASVVCGPTCVAICYGTAAPIVETNVKSLKEDLKSTKARLEGIKGQFETLEKKTGELSEEAAKEFKRLSAVSVSLKQTEIVVVNSATVWLWKAQVLPMLTSLQSTLTNALARK